MALLEDIQSPLNSLDSFKQITSRILNYIPEVVTSQAEDKNYIIIESKQGNSQKFARPYNKNLFINDSNKFLELFPQGNCICAAVSNALTSP